MQSCRRSLSFRASSPCRTGTHARAARVPGCTHACRRPRPFLWAASWVSAFVQSYLLSFLGWQLRFCLRCKYIHPEREACFASQASRVMWQAVCDWRVSVSPHLPSRLGEELNYPRKYSKTKNKLGQYPLTCGKCITKCLWGQIWPEMQRELSEGRGDADTRAKCLQERSGLHYGQGQCLWGKADHGSLPTFTCLTRHQWPQSQQQCFTWLLPTPAKLPATFSLGQELCSLLGTQC